VGYIDSRLDETGFANDTGKKYSRRQCPISNRGLQDYGCSWANWSPIANSIISPDNADMCYFMGRGHTAYK